MLLPGSTLRLMDVALFRWINGWPDAFNPLFQFLSEGNKWTWVRLLLLVVATFLIVNQRTRVATIVALLSWPLANGICDVFKFALDQPRPTVALTEINLRVGMMTSPGMPSAHSANMAAVAFAITYLAGWRYGLVWIVVAFLTGLSRIYVGVHFPAQVLVGWFAGCFAAFVVAETYRSWLHLRRPRSSEAIVEPVTTSESAESIKS